MWSDSLVVRHGTVIGGPALSSETITHGSLLYSLGLRFFHYNPTCWRRGEPLDWNLWRRMAAAGVRTGYLEQVTYKYHSAAKEGLLSVRPQVSVLVPVRNGERFLPPALASLQAQQVDLEVLVVDDGSTDGGVALSPRPQGRALHGARPAARRHLDGTEPGSDSGSGSLPGPHGRRRRVRARARLQRQLALLEVDRGLVAVGSSFDVIDERGSGDRCPHSRPVRPRAAGPAALAEPVLPRLRGHARGRVEAGGRVRSRSRTGGGLRPVGPSRAGGSARCGPGSALPPSDARGRCLVLAQPRAGVRSRRCLPRGCCSAVVPARGRRRLDASTHDLLPKRDPTTSRCTTRCTESLALRLLRDRRPGDAADEARRLVPVRGVSARTAVRAVAAGLAGLRP